MSSANPERWRRIEAVLESALKAKTGERKALLDAECAGDDALRDEVESLLAAHAASTDFLATSAESFAAPFVAAAAAREATDQPGMLVGRYRLLEPIGRGGMGVVWLASRADGEFEHRVALKLVKRGMDTAEIVARFLRERQILARLEHPNIARLLDGGVSDDGRPYFVMEYVAGKPITEHCDAANLGIDARLRLFVVTARAVGHAHRHLIVHRDIKPHNVLVDERGDIKLLDFGIAKLLGEDPDRGVITSAARLMTPEYASPEQAAGGRVTTASDVYQLGLLMYELLCGRRPRADSRESAPAVRKPSTAAKLPVIEQRDSATPLTTDPAVVSARRSSTPDRLHRRLKGDLDTIALRALREEPERRYPSAEDLAEDVERHLSHRPIRFGGDRAAYRASKFIRRHRLSVITGILVVAVGVTSGAIAVARVREERDRARYESDKATEVALLMARFLQGWNPEASDRDAVSTSKLLAAAAVRAERELSNRPDVFSATLSALGDLHTTIGDWAVAESLLTRAGRLQASLGSRGAADLAATFARRGRLYRLTGNHVEAEASLRQALAMDRERFGGRHPETMRVERELAATYRDLQRFADAESLLREILAGTEVSQGATPFELETSTELAYAIYQLGRFDEAIAILRPTLERQRALFGEEHASILSTLRALGSALRDRGDLVEAEQLYRDALRVAQALYGESHAETAGVMFVLALVLQRREDLVGAEATMRAAMTLVRRLYGPEHVHVTGHMVGIASILLDRGDLPGAESLLAEALRRVRRNTAGAGPDQGDILNRLAYLRVKRGAADAAQTYRDAVAFDDARPPGQADFVTDGLHFLAAAEHQRGDLVAAEADYRRALAVYERSLPPTHMYRVAATRGLEALRAGLPPPE